MAALRETVLRRNIFDWTLDVLDTIVGLSLRTPAPSPEPARGGRAPGRPGEPDGTEEVIPC